MFQVGVVVDGVLTKLMLTLLEQVLSWGENPYWMITGFKGIQSLRPSLPYFIHTLCTNLAIGLQYTEVCFEDQLFADVQVRVTVL